MPLNATADHIAAAGIAFLSAGKVLLLKRGDGGDYPGHWNFPAGKVEPGEMPEDAARREAMEEAGFLCSATLTQLSFTNTGSVAFTTFGAAVNQFEPTLCDESTDCMWADLDDLPTPMHPGTLMTLQSGALDAIDPRKMNELDLARAMASGALPSPQRYMNMSLFAIRITGTGVAYRTAHKEFVFRDPSIYLNDEFLARCNGLQVIAEHPDDATLTSQEFADRSIGSIFLPYISGNEVWGIAKIYDTVAAEIMEKHQLSTSPTVTFRDPKTDNAIVKLDDGETLLIEGVPALLDHVAICIQGVWDKGGPPTGVSTNNVQEIQMTEEELKAKADAEAKDKADAEAKAKADSEVKARADADEKMAKFMDSMDAVMKRMDSFESAQIKKADADKSEEEKKTDAEKAKADADEKEAAEAKAKKDEDEKSEKEKAKADAEETRKRIADLEAGLPKKDSDSDYSEMADAQAKADSVFSQFGDRADGPLRGETVLSYRKRLASKLKSHSKNWAGVDLNALDASVIDIAEQQIYADAATAAVSPTLAEGVLHELVREDAVGRKIRTFVGSPSAWMGGFKSPGLAQERINKDPK